jgi:hypothetical protein
MRGAVVACSSGDELGRGRVGDLGVRGGARGLTGRALDLTQCADHGFHVGLEADELRWRLAAGEYGGNLDQPEGDVPVVVQAWPVFDQALTSTSLPTPRSEADRHTR